MPDFDEKDERLAARRITAFDKRVGPRVGDWIDFADGATRRIAYLWPDQVQTTSHGDGDGGFYLGDGHVAFSGAQDPGVALDCLLPVAEIRPAWIWFFHHDVRAAHNSVRTTVPFRVFRCPWPVAYTVSRGAWPLWYRDTP